MSPHIIIEAVRLWLQEDQNSASFERIVFAARANVALIEKCMEQYFPLQPDAVPLMVKESVSQPTTITEGESPPYDHLAPTLESDPPKEFSIVIHTGFNPPASNLPTETTVTGELATYV